MADSFDVMTRIMREPTVSYPVLVPNLDGYLKNDFHDDQIIPSLRTALKAGAKEIAIFTAASESFTKKNINCTIEESIARFVDVVAEAKRNSLKIRG
jgi:hydroxymethylglutaryl-CoA lyase